MSSEAMPGDTLTSKEMQQRGICLVPGTRGGAELRTLESMNTVANHLVHIGFIELHQTHGAAIFLDLRRAFDASQGNKWTYLRDQICEGLGLNPSEATAIYDGIRRNLGLRRAGTVYEIIYHAMLGSYSPMPIEALEIYRRSFDELECAMEKERDERKTVATY